MNVSVLLNLCIDRVDFEYSEKKNNLHIVLRNDLPYRLIRIFYRNLGRPCPKAYDEDAICVDLLMLITEYIEQTDSVIQMKLVYDDGNTEIRHFGELEVVLEASRLSLGEEINTVNLAAVINGLSIAPFVNHTFLTLVFGEHCTYQAKSEQRFGIISFDDGSTYVDIFNHVDTQRTSFARTLNIS